MERVESLVELDALDAPGLTNGVRPPPRTLPASCRAEGLGANALCKLVEHVAAEQQEDGRQSDCSKAERRLGRWRDFVACRGRRRESRCTGR